MVMESEALTRRLPVAPASYAKAANPSPVFERQLPKDQDQVSRRARTEGMRVNETWLGGSGSASGSRPGSRYWLRGFH